MFREELLKAHREVNSLLTKLALGMGRSELNQKVVAMAENWFGERFASILKLDEAKQRLHLEFAPTLPAFYNQAIEGVEIGPLVGSCGAAAYLKESVVVSDINVHPNWAPFTELTQKAGLHACWSVPIMSSQNSVMGTFAIYSRSPSAPSEHELEVLEMLASLYAVAWEKFQLEEQLTFHANHDSLTGCLNRRALIANSQYLLKLENQYVICFFADVDKFKSINDDFGHRAGDNVLSLVGQAFQSIFNTSGLCGRYGGDEFIAFAYADDVVQLVEREHALKDLLGNIYLDGQKKVHISLGKAVANTSDLASLEELIQIADKSMYQIKHAKRV